MTTSLILNLLYLSRYELLISLTKETLTCVGAVHNTAYYEITTSILKLTPSKTTKHFSTFTARKIHIRNKNKTNNLDELKLVDQISSLNSFNSQNSIPKKSLLVLQIFSTLPWIQTGYNKIKFYMFNSMMKIYAFLDLIKNV